MLLRRPFTRTFTKRRQFQDGFEQKERCENLNQMYVSLVYCQTSLQHMYRGFHEKGTFSYLGAQS